MSLQSEDRSVATNQCEPAAARAGNGHLEDARHDPHVISMVEAEVEKRTAQLHAMTADAAYFRAQKRGFVAGHELEDWLAAEQEVIERMAAGS